MSTSFQKRPQQWLNLLGLFLIAAVGLFGLYCFRSPERLEEAGMLGLFGAGTLGMWRWSWFMVHVLRSRLYLYWVFPRWRSRANQLPGDELPSIAIVVPTFKEKTWITEKVFRAIATEAQALSQPLKLVVVTTEPEIIAIEEILRSVDPDLASIQYLPLPDIGGGKRKALAEGLRALANHSCASPPGIVALMDGDTVLSEGCLRKCLPFFQLFPRLGGLTTDEGARVLGSKFFEEWLHLRFAQRHLYMCSHALSRKVLCLTGRFSLFRAEAALEPSFADLLENDTLNDWLWGEFKFLSGDDKSTWFWVLQRGYQMIYVPDVFVETIETVSGNLTARMYQNMRRWFGNMLRNGNRALALGPNRVGWFVWYCLLDQRISFWTSLTAPGLLLVYLFQANWTGCGLVVSWLLFTRPPSLLIFSWGRDAELKPIHVFQDLLAQWSSALIKIFTQMNLAQQKWSNRGNQSRSATGVGLERLLKLGTSRFLLLAQGFCFVIALLWLLGNLTPNDDVQRWWWRLHVEAPTQPTQVLEAMDYGVVPNDDRDDALALQHLLDQLPPRGLIQINLPAGELQLLHPLVLRRSHTLIKGQGQARTILRVSSAQLLGESPITVIPPKQAVPWLEQVGLSHFTLLQDHAEVAAVAIYNVRHAWVKNLQFQGSGTQALVLKQTRDVELEYLAFDGQFTQTPVVWLDTTQTAFK